MQSETATDIISKMVSEEEPMNKYVNSYNLVYSQNNLLSNYINEMYSTDTQNILYQNKKIENYKYFNKILVIIYFILMGISVIFLIKSKKVKSIIVKFIIVALLVIYPFIIYYLESYIFEFFSYAVSFLSGETYIRTTIPSLTNTKL